MTEAQLIEKYEALGWKLLKWKDRKGNDCSGWRSPDGKQCAYPPAEVREFYERAGERESEHGEGHDPRWSASGT